MGLYVDKGFLSLSMHSGCVFFYIRFKENKTLKLEFSFNKYPKMSLYSFRDEDRLKMILQIIFFNFSITYSGLTRYIIRGEDTLEWSIAIFDWALWWCLGRPLHSWRSNDWRHSCFKLLDHILGKEKHSKDNVLQEKQTLVLPEGDYQVDMEFADYNTWRSRVPKFIWRRKIRIVDLKITPEIPHPGKNNPVSGYSQVSFPAKSIEEVNGHIYREIEQRRGGDINYYNNPYRKIVDNFMYTVNDLPINIGRVPVELHNKEWVPLGVSTAGVADETFKRFLNQKSFSNEELCFINKYMGKSNSLDFIKDQTVDDLHDEMFRYYRVRNQWVSDSQKVSTPR